MLRLVANGSKTANVIRAEGCGAVRLREGAIPKNFPLLRKKGTASTLPQDMPAKARRVRSLRRLPEDVMVNICGSLTLG